MTANDNTGDNRTNSGLSNEINNENVVITVNRDNHQISRQSSTNKSVNPNNDQNKSDDNQNNCPANKSSNRNAINFMVLGYFILVLIIFYGYFGSLISDIITNPNTKVNENQNKTIIQRQNTTESDFESNDIKNEKKFYRNITSTEVIIILWITIIYGSALLLYLRFRVLTLESDPNKPKKKKDSTEELNAFMAKSRKNRKSFKDKILNNDTKVKDDTNQNQPFWK